MADNGTPRGDVVLRPRGLSKKYSTTTRASMKYGMRDLLEAIRGRTDPAGLRVTESWALKDCSLDLHAGEALGVIGANGAGKSTLLRLLDGISPATAGSVERLAPLASILDLGAGFNEILTGNENIAAKAMLHGMDGDAARNLEEHVIKFAEIGSFIDAPVRTYSAGMKMRLAYAIAAALTDDILLIDEALAVGDLAFRQKCKDHIERHLARGGSLVLVSHSAWMIQGMCDRVLVLDCGETTFMGEAAEGVSFYLKSQSLPDSMDAWADELTGSRPLPISIDSVTVTASDGGPPRLHAPATLSISFSTSEALPPISWALIVCSEDGETRLSADLSDIELSGSGALRANRTGEAKCEIDAFPLVAGDYAVRVGAYEADSKVLVGSLGLIDSPVFFETLGGADDESGPSLAARVLTRPAIEFQPR